MSIIEQLRINPLLFSYMPKPDQLLFTLQDHPILSIGNLCGLTADIGTGKSHLCEVFASYWLTPNICTQAIKCHSNHGNCLYIDTERPLKQAHDGLLRIQKRTGLLQTEIESRLFYYPFIAIESVDHKIEAIKELVHTRPSVTLLIIDGILDLMINSNDLTESSKLGQKLVTLANTKQLGIIYTLHGNRNDTSGKGKGHIGDVLQRKSESYLKLFETKENHDERILTSDFSNGKVRNGYNRISTRFMWKKEILSFNEESLETQSEKSKISEIDELKQLFPELFAQNKILKYKELISRFVTKTHYTEATAARKLKKAIANNILTKDYNQYSLNI